MSASRLCAALLLLGAVPLPALTFKYVWQGGTHQFPFTNLVTAATNIEAAVDSAETGDIIVVTNGTYLLDHELLITNVVGIWSADYQNRYVESPDTVVDGNGHRCFVISNANAALVGFAIRNGSAAGSWPTNSGAGVFMFSSGQVFYCTFIANAVTGTVGAGNEWEGPHGGAVYGYYGGDVFACTFLANHAAGSGGAAYLYRGGSLSYSRFEGNGCGPGVPCNGGAIATYLGGSVASCTVVSNSAGYGGGGIHAWYGDQISDCTVVSNYAGWGGGGIWFQADSMDSIYDDLISCTIAGNNARYNGGGLYISGTAPSWQGTQVRYCTIRGNRSGAAGGGIYCAALNTVKNTVIEDNASVDGGGVAFVGIGGPPQRGGVMQDCAVRGNSAGWAGGGLYSSQKALVYGCLLTNNTAGDRGGGAWLHYSGTLFSNILAANVASNVGGGVAFEYGGEITQCLVRANTALTNGGGLYFAFAGIAQYSDVSSNSAQLGGGAWCAYGGTALACRIEKNTAAYGAGAGMLETGLVRNCLLAENWAAGSGGGIFGAFGGMVENCTIVANRAQDTAGGIWSGTNLAVLNSIIYDNTAVVTAANHAAAFSVTLDYCCTEPVPAGQGNMPGPPQFQRFPVAYYNLMSNSPCIEAGTNMPWMTEASDLDGRQRIMNPVVDIGALEFPTSALLRISAPAISFSPAATVVGEAVTSTVAIANIGALGMTGAVTGLQTPPFSVAAGSPYTLLPGMTGSVTFVFAPQSDGGWTNSVTLSGGGGATLLLYGTAIPEPAGALVAVALMALLRRRGHTN